MSSPCRRTLETTLCRKKPFCLTSLSVNTQAIGVRPVEPMKVEAPVFISLPHTGHCMVHSPCCDSLRRPKPSGRSILSQRRRIFQRGEKNSGSGRLSAGKAPGENQKVFAPWDKDLFSVITQHYRFFISADYLLPDMELQQKEQLQTQDQHEHADHQKRYVHQKQKAHPAYLLPQGKTPHQYGHSIFAGF